METKRGFSKRFVTVGITLLLVCLGPTILPTLTTAEDLSLAPGVKLMPSAGWESIRPRAGQAAILNLRGANGRIVGRATVSISNRRTADNAVAQLGWNVPKVGIRPTLFDIAGWPAVTFTTQVDPDQPEDGEIAGPSGRHTRVDTLVAVDKTLVRISISLGRKPSADVIKRAYELAKGLRVSKTAPAAQTRRSLEAVKTSMKAQSVTFSLPAIARDRAILVGGVEKKPSLEPTAATSVGPGRELEIAVSEDERDIVIVSNNSQIFTSNDFGTTFAVPVDYPTPSPSPGGSLSFTRRSDLSVVRGPSGRFYVSFLGRENFPGLGRDTVSVAVSESQDRGTNFRFLSNVVRCEDDEVFTTDQPHLAVDPRVRNGPDQVYVGWRANQPDPNQTVDCNGGRGKMLGFHTMLSCSADGGLTWTKTQVDTFGMYPRVTVGPDGMVYLISETHRGLHTVVDPDTGREVEVPATMFLSKYSSCEQGLQLQTGFPAKVTDFSGIRRIPGLDRNNSGNILPSPTVALTSPRHVFVAYAERRGFNDDDIVVLGSVDGGEDETWSLRTTANAATGPAQRFMPWLCASTNQLFVSWYDRRDATAAANDLTKYFVSFVEPVDTNDDAVPDVLRALESSVSSQPDPMCRWWSASAPRNENDSDNCSAQPQLAGRCCVLDADDRCDNPSSRRCDFDQPGVGAPPCLAGETCSTGGGRPKYGDYTGNTCHPSRAFLTWAAATNPDSGDPLSEAGIFFAKADVTVLRTTFDLCSDGRCGAVRTRNPGDLLFNCPGGDCRIVLPLQDICQRVLNCPGCGPDVLCQREFTFNLTGMDFGWNIRFVDEKGQPVPGKVSRAGDKLAITIRPEKSPTIKNTIGRYMLVLERNRPGKKETAARIRVAASPP